MPARRLVAAGSLGERDQDDLAAFPANPQDPVAVFFAKVTDIRTGGLEDPQAEQPEHGDQGEVVPVSGPAGRGE
jgi:hypothetical protein